MKKIISLILLCFLSLDAFAATAGEIEIDTDATMKKFYAYVKNGPSLVSQAKGVLVFPGVYKAGVFFLGGEYGEGALQIDGQTVDYYSTAAGSFGFQLGAQKKSVVILFLEDNALNNFRNSENWEVGVDASIALVDIGAGGSIDTTKLNKPIIAFVFNQKGLMYNLTLEGSKFTKLNK